MFAKNTAIQSLIKPCTIAIVGASAKPGSAGNAMVLNLLNGIYSGKIFPVNPGYDTIEGLTCYPNLASLPKRPDLAILGVSNAQLEAIFDDVIALGIPAITIFASGVLEDDTARSALLTRLKIKAKTAGIAICGPNCMGLIHPKTGLNVGTFTIANTVPAGGIAWLAQSGSAFSALTYNQPRMGFALAISTGAEIATTLSDYMLWALEQPETRVMGIFLEGVRDPVGFVAALEQARLKDIPVVILKVGRTQKSAQMAESHAGALVGNDGAYKAIFRRYNVIQVDDLDEMAVTLALLDTDRRTGVGALATMHDSGGERELLVDMADVTGTPLAEISEVTKALIQPNLETGLIADNPLDAYGTTNGYVARYTTNALALLDDPATAMLGFFSDPRDENSYHEGLVQAVLDASKLHKKPVFIASNSLMTTDTTLCETARSEGVPLVKGTRATLLAVRRIIDHAKRPLTRWPDPVSFGGSLSVPENEADGLGLLKRAGIETPGIWRVSDAKELAKVASGITYPVVLKTDEGHAHKSEVGGVVLNLSDPEELATAYRDVAARLGPRVILMEMAPTGVEIGLGAFVDSDFGPVITVSAGGILIEVFHDVSFALAPFDCDTAREMLCELSISKMLVSHRGKPAVDTDRLCGSISQFSHLIFALRDQIFEADVNPIIATTEGAIAVDALFIASKPET